MPRTLTAKELTAIVSLASDAQSLLQAELEAIAQRQAYLNMPDHQMLAASMTLGVYALRAVVDRYAQERMKLEKSAGIIKPDGTPVEMEA